MSACLHDLLSQPQVVVQGVQVFCRVEQVAGVAQRHLRDAGPGGEHRVDGRLHLRHVVECVKNAEDVNAAGGSFLHERIRHLGRVRRVPHRVAAAQQHLNRHVGHRLTQQGEPVPRILGEEAQGHVVGGTAPRFHRQQLRGESCHVGGDGEEILGAHTGG